MVKRDFFFPQYFLEIVSSFYGLKGVKNASPCGLILISASFCFMASQIYLPWRCLAPIPEQMWWVSSKDFLRLKQNRNRGKLLLDGFVWKGGKVQPRRPSKPFAVNNEWGGTETWKHFITIILVSDSHSLGGGGRSPGIAGDYTVRIFGEASIPHQSLRVWVRKIRHFETRPQCSKNGSIAF